MMNIKQNLTHNGPMDFALPGAAAAGAAYLAHKHGVFATMAAALVAFVVVDAITPPMKAAAKAAASKVKGSTRTKEARTARSSKSADFDKLGLSSDAW